MEGLSEKEGSQFGMADNVEAEVIRNGEVLKNETAGNEAKTTWKEKPWAE